MSASAAAAASTTSAIAPVVVKIVSDIVWPFCFIGLRHLELASEKSGVPTKLTWEPFLLNPNMKEEGEDIKEHLYKKYGAAGIRNFGDVSSGMFRTGRKVGIEFTVDRNVYPTVRAHAIMEYVNHDLNENERANQIMEELYKRYFEQGQNINSVEVLQEVCAQVGIDDLEMIRTVAEDPERQKQVKEKDQYYKNGQNIHGVPFYIIEPRGGSKPVGFSGAQPPDLIAEYLSEAAGV